MAGIIRLISADDTSSSAMLSAKARISGTATCRKDPDRLPCDRLSMGLSDRQLRGDEIRSTHDSSGSVAAGHFGALASTGQAFLSIAESERGVGPTGHDDWSTHRRSLASRVQAFSPDSDCDRAEFGTSSPPDGLGGWPLSTASPSPKAWGTTGRAKGTPAAGLRPPWTRPAVPARDCVQRRWRLGCVFRWRLRTRFGLS